MSQGLALLSENWIALVKVEGVRKNWIKETNSEATEVGPMRSDDILHKGGGGRDEQHWSDFNDRADRISCWSLDMKFETKREVYIFGLSNWQNSAAINWDGDARWISQLR